MVTAVYMYRLYFYYVQTGSVHTVEVD